MERTPAAFQGGVQGDVKLFFNPNSTRADSARAETVAALTDHYGRSPVVMDTPSAKYADNTDCVAKNITPGDIVVVVGGDGMVNTAANGVRMSGLARDQGVRMLLVPGGNANDIASSLHGGNILRRGGLPELLAKGETFPMSAIEAAINDEVHWSLGYFGIGMTGAISAQYADMAHRATRPKCIGDNGPLGACARRWADAHDSWVMAKQFLGQPPFAYQEVLQDDSGAPVPGESRVEAYELLAFNVKRFAKVMRFDADALQPEVKLTEFDKRNFLGRLARRTLTEAMFYAGGLKGETLQRRRLRILSPFVLAQYDGEPILLDEGSTVDISPRPAALDVVALPARR